MVSPLFTEIVRGNTVAGVDSDAIKHFSLIASQDNVSYTGSVFSETTLDIPDTGIFQISINNVRHSIVRKDVLNLTASSNGSVYSLSTGIVVGNYVVGRTSANKILFTQFGASSSVSLSTYGLVYGISPTQVQNIVIDMVTDNTETGISVTGSNGKLNFAVTGGSGGEGGITESAALALIATYARASSPTGRIAKDNIPSDVVYDADISQHIDDAEINGQIITFTRQNNDTFTITLPSSSGGGLSQAQVDARVRALVQLFARDSVTDIPDSKVSNNIARLANINPDADPEPVSTAANRGTGNRMARQDHVHARGDITQSEITTIVQNIIGDMVSGNTETGISVTKVNDKLNFVVTISGGGNTPSVATHQIYGAYKAAVPPAFTAAQFTAGVGTTNGVIRLSGVSGGRQFIAFWSAEQLTHIEPVGRLAFGATNDFANFTETRLSLGSPPVNGYVYTSTSNKPVEYINGAWRLA